MRFTEEVVLFDFAGIPMVGCLGTGYAIGLTEQGAAVCARMLEEDVPEDDVTAVDPALLEHLARGGFFQRVVAEPRVLSRTCTSRSAATSHVRAATRWTSIATVWPTRLWPT